MILLHSLAAQVLTSITGAAITITNDAPNVVQNLFETLTGDSGSVSTATTI